MRLNRKDDQDGVGWDEIIGMGLDHLIMLSLPISRVLTMLKRHPNTPKDCAALKQSCHNVATHGFRELVKC